MNNVIKDPDATLDYSFDWSEWLDGDTISTSSWVACAGIVIESDSADTTKATAWVSGGDAGGSYTLTNTIITAAGRTDERSITIKCFER